MSASNTAVSRGPQLQSANPSGTELLEHMFYWWWNCSSKI